MLRWVGSFVVGVRFVDHGVLLRRRVLCVKFPQRGWK